MIKSICDDIYRLFTLKIKKTHPELFSKAREINNYLKKNSLDCNSLQYLIDLERNLITSSGPHKQFIEQHILETLSTRVYFSIDNDALWGSKNKKYDTALLLINFMKEILVYTIPRDNFNSKRKSLALKILMHLSNRYEIPEIFDFQLSSLKSNRKDLILAAINFYENYCRKHAVPLDRQVIEILDRIILKTKDRSVAVSALNVQVETGEISELNALSRIDEWKQKNYY